MNDDPAVDVGQRPVCERRRNSECSKATSIYKNLRLATPTNNSFGDEVVLDFGAVQRVDNVRVALPNIERD